MSYINGMSQCNVKALEYKTKKKKEGIFIKHKKSQIETQFILRYLKKNFKTINYFSNPKRVK